jgi:translation initiation factor IF-1
VKEPLVESSGVVIAAERAGFFRVRLHMTDRVVLARCKGKMAARSIKIAAGDDVRLEFSIYDSERARITYRWPRDTRDRMLVVE